MDVGYARVSTDKQDLKLQLDALRKAGVDEIRQERASGRAGADRPVRDAVLRELQAGDTLTVWKLDRLGRSVIELHAIVDDLKVRGISFRSLTESIDTTSAHGKLFFHILSAFAEFEREIIRERTKAGLAVRVDNGLPHGGAPVFGFGELQEGKRVGYSIVDDDEAALLREAAGRLLGKESLSAVVDDWNARGETVRGGERWVATTLRRHLLNPKAAAILGKGDYDALERMFTAPDRQKQGRPAQHLLSGILHCQCGQAMYAKHAKARNGDPILIYACRSTNGGRFQGCGQNSIAYAETDQWLTEAAMVAVCSERFTEALNARRAVVLQGSATTEQLDEWKVELGDHLSLPARFRTPETDARTTELRQAIGAAQARLSAAPELRELLSLPRTQDAWRAAWAGWDVPERRRVLRLLLDQVTVKAGRGFSATRLVPDWRF